MTSTSSPVQQPSASRTTTGASMAMTRGNTPPAVSSTAGFRPGGLPPAQHQSLLQSRPPQHIECQDQQCAEEECDPEECGDEQRPPRDDNFTCGIDRRPLLPVLLVTSTVIGLICMLMLQFPLARDLLAGASGIRVFFMMLYLLTLGTMAYAALCDPGQLTREDQRRFAAAQAKGQEAGDEEMPLPKRAHKTWLYKMAIRRYDHYCRWLTNCIGLLNHREFVVMLVGLVSLGPLGAIFDLVLFVYSVQGDSNDWAMDAILVIHGAYSVALTTLATPILRLHIGFISRNELANEWKRNEFYVVHSAKINKLVAVNDLSDDEFNDRFDSFQYDAKRNAFDKGTFNNCWKFWCLPRWKAGQLGEF